MESKRLNIFWNVMARYRVNLSTIRNLKFQFSIGIHKSIRQEILNILQIAPSNTIGYLLCCSNIHTRWIRSNFDGIKQQKDKISPDGRFLFYQKQVKSFLNKSNLLGIFQNSMNCFKVPKYYFKDINNRKMNFFFFRTRIKTSMRFVLLPLPQHGDKICRPKC